MLGVALTPTFLCVSCNAVCRVQNSLPPHGPVELNQVFSATLIDFKPDCFLLSSSPRECCALTSNIAVLQSELLFSHSTVPYRIQVIMPSDKVCSAKSELSHSFDSTRVWTLQVPARHFVICHCYFLTSSFNAGGRYDWRPFRALLTTDRHMHGHNGPLKLLNHNNASTLRN